MCSSDLLSAAFAKQDGPIQETLKELPTAVVEFRKTFDKLNSAVDSFNLLALELGPQDAGSKKALAGKQPGELYKTIEEARLALTNINGAAAQVNQLLADSKAGIRDFSNTGLAEISQTIRELRKLTDSLNVIATKLERDPAGFVFSGKQGYTPK